MLTVMPMSGRCPADRLPEWVERAKIAAGWMIGLRPPVTTFGRDVQGLVVIAAQMADLLPEAIRRFRHTEKCIGEGDCLNCPYATEDNGEQCFGLRLARASEIWRNGEADKS